MNMPQNRGSGVKIGSKIALGSALKAWHVPIEVPTTSQAIEERFQGSRYGRIHYTVHTFGDGMGLAPKAMVYHFYGRLWYGRLAVPMVKVWAIALYRCMVHGVRRTPCVLWRSTTRRVCRSSILAPPLILNAASVRTAESTST